MAVAAALSSPAMADPGAWQVQDKTSALDGSHNYIATLASNDPVAGRHDKMTNATLGLTCTHLGLSLVIQWPDLIDKQRKVFSVPLTWKLDDGTVQTSDWGTTKTGLVEFGDEGLS